MRLFTMLMILMLFNSLGLNGQVDSFQNEAGHYLYIFDSASIATVRSEISYLYRIADECESLAANAQSFLDKELELRQAFDFRIEQKDKQIQILEQTNLLSLKEMELSRQKEQLLTEQIAATAKRNRKRKWSYVGYGFASGIILGLLGITALR